MDRAKQGRQRIIWFLVICQYLAVSGVGAVPVFTSMSVDAVPVWDRVRVFLSTTSEPSSTDIKYFSNPFRVQITLAGRWDNVSLGMKDYSDSYLRSVLVAEEPRRNQVRLTAYLSAPTSGVKTRFSQTDSLNFFYIDIPRPQRYQQPTWTPAGVERAKATGMPVVVIDPGHGSWEPGAISKYRESLQEKDVNLSIGVEVNRILKKNGRVYPVMTRSADYYPTLDDRVDLIRDTAADLFVSIHADSTTSRTPSGFCVWTIDRSRSDVRSEAKRLLKFGWQPLLARYSVGQQNLMMTRQERFVTDESERAARVMVASLDRVPSVENRGAKTHEKALRVLRHNFAPSILIETGFLSNRQDSERLAQTKHRERMAQAIAHGIESYFVQTDWNRVSPPLKSPARLAKSPTVTAPSPIVGETVSHRVRKQETLSGLAKQYGVEKEDILIASQLPLNRRILYTGETLRIPVAGPPEKTDISSTLSGSRSQPARSGEPASTRVYRVTRSDTPLGIAHRHGITVSDLLRLNGWSDGRKLRAGESILVPEGDGSRGSAEKMALNDLERVWTLETQEAAEAAQVVVKETESDPQLREYSVRPGDTLSAIADNHGTTVEDLRRFNTIRNDIIKVGQNLRVPAGREIHEHRVQKGETLSEIASRFGVSVEDLRRHNGLKGGMIRPGQSLRIPPGKVT
jgi:N-acetylmuramoyl-L-alanine amidase